MVNILPRHKEVLKKMVENGGMSRSEAMRRLEYSEAYILSGKLSDTDSWNKLMETYLPDKLLAKRHKELLNKREIIREFNDTTGLYDKKVIDQPDTNAVKSGLDMAYKLKRRYEEKPNGNIYNFNIFTNEQAQRIARRILNNNSTVQN